MDKPGFSFSELVQLIGAPAAMMAVICWLWLKGYIVTAREVKERDAAKDNLIARLDKQLADERVETIRWRDHAIDNMRLAKQQADTVQTAVKKIPKAKGGNVDGQGEQSC